MAWILVLLVLVLGGGWLAFRCYPHESYHFLLQHMLGYRHFSKRFLLVDGLKWSYLEGGNPEGDIVVMLHGYTSEKSQWGHLPKGLMRDYRIIMPDIPGFGESDKHAELSYVIPEQALRLRDFLDALDVPNCHMVGISMGGGLTGWFASEWPDRVKTITLMAPMGIEPDEMPEVFNEFSSTGDNVLVFRDAAGFRRVMALIHHRPPPSWLPIDEVFVAYVGGNHDHFANIGSELMEHGLFFLEDRLANLTMPVLLLWGDDDRVMDFSCINKYIDQVPDLQYRLYPNVGHVIWADAPGRTLRDMRRFLSRHRSGIKPLPTSGVRPASG